jgi:hypothetical protein
MPFGLSATTLLESSASTLPYSDTVDTIPITPTKARLGTQLQSIDDDEDFILYKPIVPKKPNAVFTIGSVSSSEYSLTDRSTSPGGVTPILYGTTEAASSITSLDFNDDGLKYGFPESSTVAFPNSHLELQPSDKNGTAFYQILWRARSPRQSTTDLLQAAHSSSQSLSWNSVKSGLGKMKNEAADSVSDHLNQACRGLDVPEIGNAVVGIIPTVRLPRKRDFYKNLDSLTDKLQDLSTRKSRIEVSSSGSPTEIILSRTVHGSQWKFAREMGQKARDALVKQGICLEFQALPGRNSSSWQDALNKALVNFFQDPEHGYTLEKLLEMEPHWIDYYDKKVWKLVLDTGNVEIVCDREKLVETPEQLETGFELPEQNSWKPTRNPVDGMTKTTDDSEGEVYDYC